MFLILVATIRINSSTIFRASLGTSIDTSLSKNTKDGWLIWFVEWSIRLDGLCVIKIHPKIGCQLLGQLPIPSEHYASKDYPLYHIQDMDIITVKSANRFFDRPVLRRMRLSHRRPAHHTLKNNIKLIFVKPILFSSPASSHFSVWRAGHRCATISFGVASVYRRIYSRILL